MERSHPPQTVAAPGSAGHRLQLLYRVFRMGDDQRVVHENDSRI